MSLEEQYRAVRSELEKVIFGQEEVIEFSLAAVFSCGHLLLEGPPGVAKTMLVRTIADALDLDFRRVQMTPDLLPNDITGSSVYRDDTRTFEFRQGPLFANFLLADEINRASARTQSSLLEAMQELQVTYDGVSHQLPEPFMTFATQNPIEQEGTYPLPLAQLDRFMFKVHVGYPEPDAEIQVLTEHHANASLSSTARSTIQRVMTADDVLNARNVIRKTFVREEVIRYVQSLLQATRDDDSLSVGASPRAGLMLIMAAKSLAQFSGRDYVNPDDIQSAFLPVMRHRVVLSPSAELDGTTADELLARVIEFVEVPR